MQKRRLQSGTDSKPRREIRSQVEKLIGDLRRQKEELYIGGIYLSGTDTKGMKTTQDNCQSSTTDRFNCELGRNQQNCRYRSTRHGTNRETESRTRKMK